MVGLQEMMVTMGSQEILILILLMILLLIPTLIVIYLIYTILRGRDKRIKELEARVNELEELQGK